MSEGPKPIARLKLAQAPSGRIHERATIGVPLRLRVPSIDQAILGEAVNISRGGMFLTMAQPLAVGTRIDVEITAGKNELILHAAVEVVRQQWTPPIGVGVRFVEVSFEAQELIERMVLDQRLIGDYRLERLVGRGGMAEVYRAKALHGPAAGETVALKRLRPELSQNATAVSMFRRECEIMMALKHPGIVEVYEVGEISGCQFIAMELIDGYDLREIIAACARKKIFLPVDFACVVVHRVAEALHFAHQACSADGTRFGLVHRDISPSNIFISRRGDIKLGDFGVAHVTSAERDGTIVGKDPYLAPEQLHGQTASAATDVFSLTAVFYELLTNRLAFPGDSAKAIAKKILGGDVVAPSKLRPEIGEDVEQVIARGLASAEGASSHWLGSLQEAFAGKRLTRYRTADELAVVLRPLFDDRVGNELAIAAIVQHLFGDA